MRFAVGTYTCLGGPGIAICAMENGALSLLSGNDEVCDPTWLLAARDGRTLYAACESRGDKLGQVASFALAGDRLTLTSFAPSLGRACCHLALDDAERCLYAANYIDASVAMFPVVDGLLRPAAQRAAHEGCGPNKTRQTCAHAHQVTLRPGGKQLFVCDLGADDVFIYQIARDGALALSERIKAPAGSGPRHLVFDGADAFYLVGEVDSTVSYYRRQNGAWLRIQTLSTLPGECPGNTAAAIRMSARYVYVSNRGHDSIAVFARQPDGTLAPAGHIGTPGRVPRDFILTDGGFLIAHQEAGGVALIDESGALLSSLPIPGAVCICPLQ